MANPNGKTTQKTITDDELIIRRMWRGRLVVTFARPSVLLRARAWEIVNEIRAQYPNQTEITMLADQLASYGVVMSAVVSLEIAPHEDDNKYLRQFIEWCKGVGTRSHTDLFSDLMQLPPDFYDILVEAYNDRPVYAPLEQRPIDKIPEGLKEAALDPKAS